MAELPDKTLDAVIELDAAVKQAAAVQERLQAQAPGAESWPSICTVTKIGPGRSCGGWSIWRSWRHSQMMRPVEWKG